MKKLWIAFAMALLALVFVAGPVLADGGNASVTCSDITVTDDSPVVGTTITFYGTVTIVANASATTDYVRSHTGNMWSGSFTDKWTVADTQSYAWYEIRDPDGNLVASDSNTESAHDEGVSDWVWVQTGPYPGQGYWDWGCVDDAYADAGQTFDWNADVPIDLVGDYIATQGGTVTVYYGNYSQTAHYVWTYCGYEWSWDDPVPNVSTLTDEGSATKTVTSHAGAGLGMVASPARLVIQLPSGLAVEKPLHSKSFFSSDGWGDPTSDTIVYNDGTWQVEIPHGTVVQLDGEWHKYTWIEVDGQGNVIGKYGSDGHTIAEDIGLSQPITVTKVG
jgi:hypothetical protein